MGLDNAAEVEQLTEGDARCCVWYGEEESLVGGIGAVDDEFLVTTKSAGEGCGVSDRSRHVEDVGAAMWADVAWRCFDLAKVVVRMQRGCRKALQYGRRRRHDLTWVDARCGKWSTRVDDTSCRVTGRNCCFCGIAERPARDQPCRRPFLEADI